VSYPEFWPVKKFLFVF